jgi:large subunit ribosomal protein L5
MDKEHNCYGVKMQEKNKMREIEIEKMIVSCGAIDEKLDRSVKLIQMITNKKVIVVQAKKRIPTFGISPGKKAGCKVTIRDKEEIHKFLKRFFSAVSNKLKKKSIAKDHFSFGIKEYIEVPGLEYKRDIGILGFEVDVVFKRKGKRVKMKKIKQGKYPEKQKVTKEEIIEYLTKNLEVNIDDSK